MGITREEQLLKSVATGVASDIKPITREEQYLSYIGGGSSVLPAQPITRKEVLLDTIAKNGIGSGGGGGVTINNQNKTITENGTYTADEGYTGLGTVTVDVASGGGDVGLSGISITKMSCGTVTPSFTTNYLLISHELGCVPKVILIFTEEGTTILNQTEKAGIATIFSIVLTDTEGVEWNAKQITGKGNTTWSALGSIYSKLLQGGHTITDGVFRSTGVKEVDATTMYLQCKNGANLDSVFLPITYKWFCLA